ncbi:uncharacterized protein LOC111695678 [Eurytemora carolleeae]|uniref:uncharacterized protein LOC111695678 n=1 Tax=Eurytemora carolleeae TaxID=1294199 RepID=UPI000C77EE02|nr:uncharacterized protein LOC111695678 [Eurytemora carolleeae]|eukprot:XP_023320851.1 uncharacterized protein LOC111695678 [Eurytemora affinis]
MLSYFSNPDLRRGDENVMLQSVQWNSELKLSNRPQRQSESYYKKASSLSYQPRQPKTSLQQDIHRRRFGSEIGLQGLGWTVSDAEFGSLGADQRRDSINTLYGDFRDTIPGATHHPDKKPKSKKKERILKFFGFKRKTCFEEDPEDGSFYYAGGSRESKGSRGSRPKYAQSELGSSKQRLNKLDARYASSILRGFSSTDTGFVSSEAGFIDSETSETSDSETDKQSGVTEIEVKEIEVTGDPEIEVTGDPERKISDQLYLPMQSLKGILAAEGITQEPAEKCEDTAEPKEEENVETDVVESTESETESSHENSLNFEEIDASTESLTESVPWKEETTKMVSRRAILSRSRDDLNMDENKMVDDQWFSKEKLYKDHILEVLEKWDNIDDEIWAKVIVLERNRRIAKAYARAPVLTVNGSEDGFDGFRIGVNGFENPLRDPKTEEFKKQIGTGCKLKMDDTGNILVKRLSKSNIYVKNTIEENAVSNDILKLPNGQLEAEKPFKLFDMKKFQQNVNRELKRQYPERYKLETQCISTIALVKNESEVLDSPIWIMLINVVALEMLKAKMPRISGPSRGIGQYPLKKLAGSGSSDEDPYSLTPSGSSGSSGKGPRGPHEVGKKERDYYGPQNWAVKGGVNDLSDEYIEDEMNLGLKSKLPSRSRTRNNKKTDEKMDRLDDPYYNGMSARVPAFGRKVEKQPEKHFNRMKSPTRLGGVSGKLGGGVGQIGGGAGQAWWHSRLYPEGFPESGVSLLHVDQGAKDQRHVEKDLKTKELSSYHDGGRGNAQQLPRNRFASPSRPTIFRSGWE